MKPLFAPLYLIALLGVASLGYAQGSEHVVLTPGAYRITYKLVKANLPAPNKTKIYERCLDAAYLENIESSPNLLIGDDRAQCETSDFTGDLTTGKWKTRCEGKNKLKGDANVKFAETTYLGEANIASTWMGIDVKATFSFAGERIGDCSVIVNK